MRPCVQPRRFLFPLLLLLRRLQRLGRVRPLLPILGALPVRHVRRVQLRRSQVFGLRPRERPAVLTKNGATRRQVSRQIRRIKNVPGQRRPEIKAVVVAEVRPQRPAILPKEVREA